MAHGGGVKLEWLARLGHDLRSPVNGILGLAGLLHDTDLTRGQREYVEGIQASAEALLTNICNALDLAAIETGTPPVAEAVPRESASVERSTAASPSAPLRTERARLRILLAEDDTITQKVALAVLRRLGYHADLAANGLEVLRTLERQAYDVVLMDLQMPELDGLATSREICRRWPREGRPRIVATTASDGPEIREECRMAGIDDFVGKADSVEAWGAMLQRCSSGDHRREPS